MAISQNPSRNICNAFEVPWSLHFRYTWMRQRAIMRSPKMHMPRVLLNKVEVSKNSVWETFQNEIVFISQIRVCPPSRREILLWPWNNYAIIHVETLRPQFSTLLANETMQNAPIFNPILIQASRFLYYPIHNFKSHQHRHTMHIPVRPIRIWCFPPETHELSKCLQGKGGHSILRLLTNFNKRQFRCISWHECSI